MSESRDEIVEPGLLLRLDSLLQRGGEAEHLLDSVCPSASERLGLPQFVERMPLLPLRDQLLRLREAATELS